MVERAQYTLHPHREDDRLPRGRTPRNPGRGPGQLGEEDVLDRVLCVLVDCDLHGVRLAISDAHAGLRTAIRRVIQDAASRDVGMPSNLLAVALQSQRQVISALILTIFAPTRRRRRPRSRPARPGRGAGRQLPRLQAIAGVPAGAHDGAGAGSLEVRAAAPAILEGLATSAECIHCRHAETASGALRWLSATVSNREFEAKVAR